MRICLVYDCLFPYTVGGAERWYRNLAERLAADGHEVTYLTLRQWDAATRPDLPGVRVVAAGPRMALYSRRRAAPDRAAARLRRRRARAPAAPRPRLRRRAHRVVSVLLAAGGGAARPLGGYRLVVDWHEVWTRDYWREYLGRVGGRVGWRVQRAVPARAASGRSASPG